MKFYLLFTKKTLAVMLSLIILGIVIMGQYFSASNFKIDGDTNEKRVSYIKSLGIEPEDSEVSFKEITIPAEFSDVYKEYNSLQKKAGFDLSRYKSKPAVIYTYGIAGSNSFVHLIVFDGKIIGGDIAEVNLNGQMKPLLKLK